MLKRCQDFRAAELTGEPTDAVERTFSKDSATTATTAETEQDDATALEVERPERMPAEDEPAGRKKGLLGVFATPTACYRDGY